MSSIGGKEEQIAECGLHWLGKRGGKCRIGQACHRVLEEDPRVFHASHSLHKRFKNVSEASKEGDAQPRDDVACPGHGQQLEVKVDLQSFEEGAKSHTKHQLSNEALYALVGGDMRHRLGVTELFAHCSAC